MASDEDDPEAYIRQKLGGDDKSFVTYFDIVQRFRCSDLDARSHIRAFAMDCPEDFKLSWLVRGQFYDEEELSEDLRKFCQLSWRYTFAVRSATSPKPNYEQPPPTPTSPKRSSPPKEPERRVQVLIDAEYELKRKKQVSLESFKFRVSVSTCFDLTWASNSS